MRKLILFLALACAGPLARADVMYWQVSTSYLGDDYSSGWNAARVGYYTTDGGEWNSRQYLNLTFTDNPDESSTILQVSTSTAESGAYAILPASNASAYSYFIELGNYDGSTFTAVAWNEATPYSSLSSNIITTEQLSDIGSATAIASMAAFTGSQAYSPVPEPTGALLLLVGVSVLSLRRRRG